MRSLDYWDAIKIKMRYTILSIILALVMFGGGVFAGIDIRRCEDVPRLAELEFRVAGLERYSGDLEAESEYYRLLFDRLRYDKECAEADVALMAEVAEELKQERDIYYRELHVLLNNWSIEPTPTSPTIVYVEMSIELEDWDSLAELREFVAVHEDEVAIQAQAGKDGVVQFSGQCVGYAMGWRDLAVEYGKNMEICNVSPREYQRVFNRTNKNHHAVIMALVDYNLYYMEPDNGEIRLASYIP